MFKGAEAKKKLKDIVEEMEGKIENNEYDCMSEDVNQFDCGWTTEISEKELILTLNNISHDELLKKSKGVVNVQKEIYWEKESGLLFDAFPVGCVN